MRNRVPRRATIAGRSSPGRSIRWWMSRPAHPDPNRRPSPMPRPVPGAGRAAPRRVCHAALASAGQPVPPGRDPVGRPGRDDPSGLAADPGRDRGRGARRPGARRLRGGRRDGRPRDRRVRLDPAQVEALIASAPSDFELFARNPERNLTFGGANLVFGAVGGPAFVSDLDRGRRAGNFADFVDYVRLIGALDVIHQEGGGPLEPNDLPVATRHLDMYRTFAVELDKTLAVPGLRGAAGRRRARGRSASSGAWTATRCSVSHR